MKVLFFVFSLCFLSLNSAQAASAGDVLINEIAWMGTITSVNDEWIELYNNTDSPINLGGWILKAADDTPKINLTGIILPKSFYLLERTDDTTVLNIPADQIYTGALENSGETLDIYDNSSNLIDRVDNSNGWLAGDNANKQTMERKTDGNWQTSQNPEGTPKDKNSIVIQTEPQPKTEPEKPAVKEPTVEVRLQQTYPSGIVINEILPSPEGPDEENEWIEVFNQNNFEVDLSGWQITDAAGKTTTYTFPAGTKISSRGFLVLSRPETKIILNNDADGLKLIQPDGTILNSVSYEKAPQGQSYNLINSGWVWSSVLTPGAINRGPTSVKEGPASAQATAGKEKGAEKGEKGLAAVSEPIAAEQGNGSFYPFLVAFAIAIFSGFVILFLKKKIKI